MTYGVLTILLGLVIFLATRLTPAKFKESAQAGKVDQNSANKPEQAQKKWGHSRKTCPMGFENGKSENRTEREVMLGACFHRFKNFIRPR